MLISQVSHLATQSGPRGHQEDRERERERETLALPSWRFKILCSSFSNPCRFSSSFSTSSRIATNRSSGFLILANAFSSTSPIASRRPSSCRFLFCCARSEFQSRESKNTRSDSARCRTGCTAIFFRNRSRLARRFSTNSGLKRSPRTYPIPREKKKVKTLSSNLWHWDFAALAQYAGILFFRPLLLMRCLSGSGGRTAAGKSRLRTLCSHVKSWNRRRTEILGAV